jgi:putative multiple sugar transport system substrate-binding protein
MKRIYTIMLVLALMVTLFAGCTKKEEETKPAAETKTETEATTETTDTSSTVNPKYIGISMPTQSSERWIKDGAAMKELLEGKGYTVDLQYAEDDIPTQKSQVENMVTKGAAVLVIAAVDGSTFLIPLTKQLKKA